MRLATGSGASRVCVPKLEQLELGNELENKKLFDVNFAIARFLFDRAAPTFTNDPKLN